MAKFYKIELPGDSKSLQATEMYFACVDDEGKVTGLMNKPALDLTDDRYLKECRKNVDMAYDRGRTDGLDSVKSWIVEDKGVTPDKITTTEISSQEWIRARAQLHKCDKIAIICRTEKSMRDSKMEGLKYEDFDESTIAELRFAKDIFNQLTGADNAKELPRYEDFDDETVRELKAVRESLKELVKTANKLEFPEHRITENEVYNVIAYSILKDKLKSR